MANSFSTHNSRFNLANTTKDPDVLRSLMSDPDPRVRVVVSYRITDPEDLAALMRDPNPIVAYRATSSLQFTPT